MRLGDWLDRDMKKGVGLQNPQGPGLMDQGSMLPLTRDVPLDHVELNLLMIISISKKSLLFFF